MSARRWVVLILSFAATIGITAYVLGSGFAAPGPHPVLPAWAQIGRAHV